MSKSVMLSIQPKWCELIANGKKTIEIRKTKPKIDVPFKCYIYCTKGAIGLYKIGDCVMAEKISVIQVIPTHSGKVIGEFICDKIDSYDDDTVHTHSQEDFTRWDDYELDKACIHEEDLENYANDKWLYGWRISDLVIYDKPKELGAFKTSCPKSKRRGFDMECSNCQYLDRKTLDSMSEDQFYALEDDVSAQCQLGATGTRPLLNAPQSWCYVEELK